MARADDTSEPSAQQHHLEQTGTETFQDLVPLKASQLFVVVEHPLLAPVQDADQPLRESISELGGEDVSKDPVRRPLFGRRLGRFRFRNLIRARSTRIAVPVPRANQDRKEKLRG
jgi:hypothetical protein